LQTNLDFGRRPPIRHTGECLYPENSPEFFYGMASSQNRSGFRPAPE
jgi:hypothetical protein